jgi:hypothetical protein
MAKRNRTNNDLQSMYTHKAKDRVTRTPLKTEGEPRCSGREGDHSLYWPGTYTSIKSGVVKLVLRAKAKRELKEINKLDENRNNNDY